MSSLHWLDFDYSEDADGIGSFDAMASAPQSQSAALEAEVARVLAWAAAAFGAPQPLEEGGEWDCELQGTRELATTLDVRWDRRSGTLDIQTGATGAPRLTLSVTLTGTPAFCDAFRQAFAA